MARAEPELRLRAVEAGLRVHSIFLFQMRDRFRGPGFSPGRWFTESANWCVPRGNSHQYQHPDHSWNLLIFYQ